MARSQQTIYNSIITQLVTEAANIGITINATNWSRYNLQGMICWVIAGAMAITEQLWDALRTAVNNVVAQSAPQSAPWFQAMMFKFQFDATTPQVLVWDTNKLLWYYPTIDATKQVIKLCSVTRGGSGSVLIKIADSTGSALSSTIISAAQSYAQVIGVTGIYYNVVSLNADKIYLALDVYYNGQYSSIIQTNVVNAITSYMQSIPFDGTFVLSNLELAIKNVVGVNDVTFKEVQARADTTTVFTGTRLVQGYTYLLNPCSWKTISGTCLPEVSPNSLTDNRPDGSGLLNLNLIPQ